MSDDEEQVEEQVEEQETPEEEASESRVFHKAWHGSGDALRRAQAKGGLMSLAPAALDGGTHLGVEVTEDTVAIPVPGLRGAASVVFLHRGDLEALLTE